MLDGGYLVEDVEMWNTVVDQCIIGQKKYLQSLRNFPESSELFVRSPEWFPLVNSYYQFSEDYDAANRVPHRVHDKSKSGNPYSKMFGVSLNDGYLEKEVHGKFLHTNPTSFMIFGKPEIGGAALGKLLADYWKSVLITPKTLLEEEIHSGSQLGHCIEFNLRCGRSIKPDIVMDLLGKRFKSNDVLHRGFVLTGFPLVANDFFEEDWNTHESALFTAQDVFNDILDNVCVRNDPSQGGTEYEQSYRQIVTLDMNVSGTSFNEPSSRQSSSESITSGYYNNDENQVNFILNSISRYDFVFIYLKCENEEVIRLRNVKYCDAQTYDDITFPDGKSYTVDVDDELLNVKKYLKLPQDFPSRVRVELDKYRYNSLLAIEKGILDHNSNFVIKLDPRQDVSAMFNSLVARLEVLPLTRSIIPQIMANQHMEEEIGEASSPKDNSDELPQEMQFAMLQSKNVVGPLFKWSLSNWSFMCPISMTEKMYLEGKAEFAVQFLNKLFFLSDEDAMKMFIENPRKYLISPYPKPRCRALIFGPKCSHRTSITKTINLLLQGKIIDTDFLLRHVLSDDEICILPKHNTGINKVDDTLVLERMQELETKRAEQIKEFCDLMKKTIKDYVECYKIVFEHDPREISSLPSPMSTGKPEEVVKAENMLIKLEGQLKKHNIPVDISHCIELLNNEDMINEYIPNRLKEENFFVTRQSNNPEFVGNETQSNDESEMNRSIMIHLLNSIEKAIRKVEMHKDAEGWIIDGFPCDIEVLQYILTEYHPGLIYIMRDKSPNFEYLLGREKSGFSRLPDYQDVLLETTNIDAAFRSRATSTSTYKKSFRGSSNVKLTKMDDEVEVDNYYKDIVNFEEQCKEVIDYLKQNNIEFTELTVNNKTSRDIVLEVVNDVQSKFAEKAVRLTDEDRRREFDNYGMVKEDLEEGGEGYDIEMDKAHFDENRRLGITAEYCPVAYRNKGVLWKGKEQFAAKHQNQLYLLSSEESLNAFLSFTPFYTYKEPPSASKILPPRICIVGGAKVGKTTLAKELAFQMGVYYGDWEKLIKDSVTKEVFQSFVENNEPIPVEVAVNILKDFWFNVPRQNCGFVLDGFPRRPEDVELMCHNYFIPDMILELSTTPNIKERLFNLFLNDWKIESEKKSAVKEALTTIETNLWENERKKVFEKLVEEKQQMRGMKTIQEKDEDITEELDPSEDMSDIERALDEEFALPQVQEDLENNEEIQEQIDKLVEDSIQQSETYLNELRENCKSEMISWIQIDASMDVLNVYNQAARAVVPVKFRNLSYLERVYDVSVEEAEKLLACGYYQLSRFGRTCPVQMFEGRIRIQLFRSLRSRNQLFPLIHKSYIYYTAGVSNRMKFKSNPLKFILPNSNVPSDVVVRISVIGPPQSGKTVIARRIEFEYGLKHITIGSAVRYVLKSLQHSVLAKRVESVLRRGETLPPDLCISCVEAMAFQQDSTALGFVMDGFPSDKGHTQELAKLNMLPHLIIDLRVSKEVIFTRRNEYKRRVTSKFLNHLYNEWSISEKKFRDWTDREYQNLEGINGNNNKWHVWDKCNELLQSVVSELQFYSVNAYFQPVLYIGNMLVTPYEFSYRQSVFKSYCPCCLFYENALTNGGNPPDRTGLFQYKFHFYWLCNDHKEEFMLEPEKVLECNIKHSLPSILPQQTNNIEHKHLYADGNCVVCFEDNLPLHIVNTGVKDFAASYGDVAYLFDTKDCLKKFLRKPHHYIASALTQHHQPKLPPLDIQNLPTLGLLQQYDADQIVKAVIMVHRMRPFVPGLGVKKSALICMGLSLKLSNPGTPTQQRELYQRAWKKLSSYKEKLLNDLAEFKKTINPFLHYEEPLTRFKKLVTLNPPEEEKKNWDSD